MRILFRFIAIFFILIFFTALHLGLTYLLPFPFSKFNFLFAFFILWLLWSDSGMVVWLVFFSHFLLELFNASPFGLVLFSSTCAFLVSFWLYRNIFTNRSWYASTVLAIFTVTFFRLLYLLGILILYILNIIDFIFWDLLFVTWFWETFFTALVVLFFYLIMSRFSRRLSAAIIEGGIYGRS